MEDLALSQQYEKSLQHLAMRKKIHGGIHQNLITEDLGLAIVTLSDNWPLSSNKPTERKTFYILCVNTSGILAKV
eukprot:snap_masked-scaffold_5-processed-gene-12.13-mRNA-1 protein AED:1.00 eAED:1.00 QI:0/-1/0/0/-1/1/1/0/74